MLTINKKTVTGNATVIEKGKEPVEQVIPYAEVLATGHMANVGVSTTYTKNLGNYESLKVSVSLHMPCEADVDSADQTFITISKWVDDKIASILEKIE